MTAYIAKIPGTPEFIDCTHATVVDEIFHNLPDMKKYTMVSMDRISMPVHAAVGRKVRDEGKIYFHQPVRRYGPIPHLGR